LNLRGAEITQHTGSFATTGTTSVAPSQVLQEWLREKIGRKVLLSASGIDLINNVLVLLNLDKRCSTSVYLFLKQGKFYGSFQITDHRSQITRLFSSESES